MHVDPPLSGRVPNEMRRESSPDRRSSVPFLCGAPGTTTHAPDMNCSIFPRRGGSARRRNTSTEREIEIYPSTASRSPSPHKGRSKAPPARAAPLHRDGMTFSTDRRGRRPRRPVKKHDSGTGRCDLSLRLNCLRHIPSSVNFGSTPLCSVAEVDPARTILSPKGKPLTLAFSLRRRWRSVSEAG